jgi:hypothetical protein
MIFDKSGDSYKLVAAVYADETPIPEIAVDRNGFATAVDPSKRVGTLAPDERGDAFEDLVGPAAGRRGSSGPPHRRPRSSPSTTQTEPRTRLPASTRSTTLMRNRRTRRCTR